MVARHADSRSLKVSDDLGWTMVFVEVLARADRFVARGGDRASTVLRIGLGAIIFLAGTHKLVAPAAWHTYLAPPFELLWPTGVLSLDVGFILFGIGEVIFGALLLIDWHTPTVAVVTALSLAGVVINLLVGVAVGEPFVDVLIRDIGLTLLAFGVALDAGRELAITRPNPT